MIDIKILIKPTFHLFLEEEPFMHLYILDVISVLHIIQKERKTHLSYLGVKLEVIQFCPILPQIPPHQKM